MRFLVIIPTYNERENIGRLIHALVCLGRRDMDILVVDDSSPDGTARTVQDVQKTSSTPVFLLSRPEKRGLGEAYKSGFSWALERNYDFVVTMDADFSHQPSDVLRLLDVSDAVDVVIGSRYVRGGKIFGWSLHRHVYSRSANLFTRLLLQLGVQDVTAGFKRYSRRFIQSLSFDQLLASGYAFQVEMILHAVLRSFVVQEIPIVFHDRREGKSKIAGEVFRSGRALWRLFLRRRGLRK